MRLPSASWIPLAISLVITRGFCYDPVDVEGYFPAWTSPFGDNTPINFRPGKHDHQFCGVMRSASDAPSDNFPIYRTYCFIAGDNANKCMGETGYVLLCKD